MACNNAHEAPTDRDPSPIPGPSGLQPSPLQALQNMQAPTTSAASAMEAIAGSFGRNHRQPPGGLPRGVLVATSRRTTQPVRPTAVQRPLLAASVCTRTDSVWAEDGGEALWPLDHHTPPPWGLQKPIAEDLLREPPLFAGSGALKADPELREARSQALVPKGIRVFVTTARCGRPFVSRRLRKAIDIDCLLDTTSIDHLRPTF